MPLSAWRTEDSSPLAALSPHLLNTHSLVCRLADDGILWNFKYPKIPWPEISRHCSVKILFDSLFSLKLYLENPQSIHSFNPTSIVHLHIEYCKNWLYLNVMVLQKQQRKSKMILAWQDNERAAGNLGLWNRFTQCDLISQSSEKLFEEFPVRVFVPRGGGSWALPSCSRGLTLVLSRAVND